MTGGVVVPAYFHPAVAAGAWRALAAAGDAVRAVVFNVDSGPGAAPERELLAVAARLRVPVLGYVDAGYGARPAADVVADLARHRAWYPVTGVFLDRVPAGPAHLSHCAALAAAARRHGLPQVVFNHGVHPHHGYAALADALVTFEGPATAHRDVAAPRWVRDHPAAMFWHLVHDCPPDEAAAVRTRAAAHHAGMVYATDRRGVNPWDGLPSWPL
ncbi:spherulation-specific family 4 protein [Spirilliplanes yamanashiensis]|uniref:spherulation-specific family 4 protein n=1 Tax=Spirilliplanes yamanashiensis TaxID=42233 RepID=UPI0031DC194D